MTVTKTVSMPLSLLEEIMEESDVMQKDFSNTLTTLTKLGILYRRDQRVRDEENAIRLEKRKE
jgi:predicted transcriptional regulator